MRRHILLLAAATAALCVPAAAERQRAKPEVSPEVAAAIASLPGSGGMAETYEDILGAVLRPVRLNDLKGAGLDKSDVGVQERIRQAQMRAQSASRFLSYDLDDDRNISDSEIETVTRFWPRRGGGGGPFGSPEMMSRLDKDADGAVAWKELTAFAEQQMGGGDPRARRDPAGELALKMDADGNGKVTFAEASRVMGAFFEPYDENSNGVIETEERRAAIGNMRPGMEGMPDHVRQMTMREGRF